MKITENKLRSIIRNLILEVDDSIYSSFEIEDEEEDNTMEWSGDIVTDFESLDDTEGVDDVDIIDPENVTVHDLNRLRNTSSYRNLDIDEEDF